MESAPVHTNQRASAATNQRAAAATTHRDGKGASAAALRRRLTALYEAERAARRRDPYLEAHASPSSIDRQIAVFLRYVRFLADRPVVLDWGCRHAPDACLVREVLGPGVEFHGCDVEPPGLHPAFHGFAGLSYRQISHPVELPYPDSSFDAVLASGVLEHVALVGESLKELHRVVREGGLLVVTFLPNRFSLSEAVARHLGLEHHRRRYGRREAIGMLRHYGFDPIASGYHQLLPAHRMQAVLRPLWFANRWLERAWGLRMLCANLFLVAERRSGM